MTTASKSLTVATTGPTSPASASASASGSGASTPTSSSASSLHHDAAHAAVKNSSNNASNSHPLTDILVLYQKATSNFLLRQLASAYSTNLEALELLAKTNRNYGLDQAESVSTRRSYFILKQKLWILNITIFGAMLADRAEDEQNQHGQGRGLFRRRFRGSSKESPEKLVEDLWRRLIEDYCGVEGDVDGQVMVALVLLCVNQKMYSLARQITEAYLATIPEGMLIHLETAAGALTSVERGNKDPLMTHYERLVELYVVHVLTKLNEWDSARQFLEYNTVLSDSTKKTYGKILEKLLQKSLRPKKAVVRKPITSTLGPSSSLSSLSSSAVSSALDLSSAHPDAKSTTASGSVGTGQGVHEQPSGSESSASASTGSRSNKLAVSKDSSGSGSGATAVAVSASTFQRLWVWLQHFVQQISNMGRQMGPNQMMVVVGIIAFLGALSRNRARASKVMRTIVGKVMQTAKMGTTVTSL
ncbi:hypothetical protein BGX34_003698 [Mortierella sp. NVP85]|nr:hypothetical protein BGX34_003698 [Mortierella sp. NVP85]